METLPTLVILAAGMGSRYGGLKQLDPMGPNGETVLDYSVFDALQAGFKQIVFVIRRDIEEDFRTTIGARYSKSINIRYAFQDLEDLPDGFSVPHGRTRPWGTGHAVRSARHFIKGPFAVINADDFYGNDAYHILARQFQKDVNNKSGMYMVGYSLSNTLSPHGAVNRGLCSEEEGKLLSVREITGISRKDDGSVCGHSEDGDELTMADNALVSMNFWGFNENLFPLLEEHFVEFLKNRGTEERSEFYLSTLVDTLLQLNQASCSLLSTTASWFGVTYPDDKPRVQDSLQELVKAGQYPSPLDL